MEEVGMKEFEMSMAGGLTDRVPLVTGGSRGIGARWAQDSRSLKALERSNHGQALRLGVRSQPLKRRAAPTR